MAQMGMIVVAIRVTVMVVFGPDRKSESDAMKICQIDHSRDVCFDALNR